MNIVLAGYRGAGKSTVAGILSARLKWPLINLDDEIVKEAGMTIPQIVEKQGWKFFRDLEAKKVEEAGKNDRVIIDAGGGVVERPSNIAVLRKNGFVIWLKADRQTIISRIKNDTNRPSLTSGKSFLEEVEEVLKKRTPLYQQAAHLEIETTDLSPEEVCGKIIKHLKNTFVE